MIQKNNKGFVVIFITTLVLVVMISIAASIANLLVESEKISINAKISSQSYYAAEAGIEDALLRLKKTPSITTLTYAMTVGSATVNVTIPDTMGGARTIVTQGDVSDRVKKVQAVYKVDAVGVSFHYGAQVGEGGLVMGNNSRILGNVFCNGNVEGSNGATIDNDIIVAKNGNKINNVDIGGNALVYSCENSDIQGNLTYVTGGHSTGCTVRGTTTVQPDEIEPADMPISSNQINEWKTEAFAGGVINNDVVFTNGTQNILGPVQIGTLSQPKNLTVTNNARLKLTGTIYVTGNINISNNAIVELDSASYGSFSGVIIADGKITVGNNAVLRGTGGAGSYILVLSTNNSLNPSSPAIMVSNNAAGAIFYASSGMIYLSNNMQAREITGYKVRIDNNVSIRYETGLLNPLFTNGPAGSWSVENWKETE